VHRLQYGDGFQLLLAIMRKGWCGSSAQDVVPAACWTMGCVYTADYRVAGRRLLCLECLCGSGHF
jgi:hypothetical protein